MQNYCDFNRSAKPIPRELREIMSEIPLKSWNHTTVRCLAGYRANEKPVSFLVNGREIKILTILKSWREPDHLCFKVETEHRKVYELRYHEYEDSWHARESAR